MNPTALTPVQGPEATSSHTSPERCRQLESEITELAAHIHAATYRLLQLINEFDQANGWSGPGLASCAHWLNWKCGINLGAAGNGDAFLVHVHTDMETLRSNGTGAESELETGGHVSAETSRRLCCDAPVVHWLNDHKGQALSIGRKSRTVPPSIRRALQRRDQGCRFPGCTCHRFVDAHHVRHWADGGETRLDNLVLLCRRHHRLVHEGGFGVHPGAEGAFVFTDPAGKTLPQAPAPRFRGNVLNLTHENHREGLNITPRTGECHWLGEKLDLGLAIEGLVS